MLTQKLQIHAADGTWVVRTGGAVIGESSDALELVEGDYPPVIYFPRDDLGMAFIETSDTTVPSRSLGAARYFHIAAESGLIQDAGWSYEAPPPEAARIAGYIAFDGSKVTVEQV